jgi:hypothetical protein
MITKRQLIELLESLKVSDDTPVVTPGFDESEYDHIDEPTLIDLVLDVNQPGHVGCHVKAKDGDDGTTCILINFD